MAKSVVIIGHKGVGKTSLFRYLATRYPVESKNLRDSPITNCKQSLIRIEENYYNIIDTSFWNLKPQTILEKDVQMSIFKAVEKSNLVCLIVDSSNEETIQLGRYFRRLNKNKCLLLNKKDLVNYNLGLCSSWENQNIIAVSVLHEENPDSFLSVLRSLYSNDLLPETSLKLDKEKLLPEENINLKQVNFNLIIIGVPNCGKSTLMKALLREEASLISSVAGTTQEPVFRDRKIAGISFQLIDTAGVKTEQEINKGLWRKCGLALVLIDATLPITKQILKLASLGVKSYKSIILVLNKIDLVKKFSVIVEELRERLHILALIVTTSSLKGWGVFNLITQIKKVVEESQRNVSI